MSSYSQYNSQLYNMRPEVNKYDNINTYDTQFISDIKAIVYTAKQKAYQAADLFQVAAN